MKTTYRDLGWDTAAVLFFLTVEVGRTLGLASLESAAMLLTAAMVLVLPFFLENERSVRFGNWMIVRGAIGVGGAVVGTWLPPSFGSIPMTLLILTAMVSCYVQFYGLIRLRPVK